MKEGLNRMDVKKYHNMLRDGVPIKIIAKRLHTKVEVLKRFTPEKVEAAAKKAKEIEEASKKEMAERKKSAEILSEAAAKTMKGDLGI